MRAAAGFFHHEKKNFSGGSFPPSAVVRCGRYPAAARKHRVFQESTHDEICLEKCVAVCLASLQSAVAVRPRLRHVAPEGSSQSRRIADTISTANLQAFPCQCR